MKKIRVTSGKYRGAILSAPGDKTHPMGAREKLALFNMVASDLPGAVVLDAYAGTGALGIEALSRDAKEVVFVEKNPKVARIIGENLRGLNLNGEVVIDDIKDFATKKNFDLIIADPPYDNFAVGDVAGLARFLNKGGILVLSHPGDAPEVPGLKLRQSRRYARARISIYDKHN